MNLNDPLVVAAIDEALAASKDLRSTLEAEVDRMDKWIGVLDDLHDLAHASHGLRVVG